jgi:hypothetical protein
MAKGGRRKGAGRKPGDRRVALLVRVTPEIRSRLERDAKRGRRSLSAEAETYFNYALRKARPEPQMRALSYLIEQTGEIAKSFERTGGAPEFNWQKSRFDFEALKSAIVGILDWLSPNGAVEDSRYSLAQTPEELGRIIASTVRAVATTPGLRQLGDNRDEPAGSLFYAFPQAANDLGLQTQEPKS